MRNCGAEIGRSKYLLISAFLSVKGLSRFDNQILAKRILLPCVHLNHPGMSNNFRFQQFTIKQEAAAMKVGTDGVLLGAWAMHPAPAQALDIGAGTGLIALMLAQRFTSLQVDAVEIDEAAAAEARGNVQASPFAERIQVHAQSIQDFARVTPDRYYDLMVSNPPFFTGGILSEQEGRSSARHTVKLSHQDLLRSVQRLLAEEGCFCVVLPWLEGLRFEELARSYQLFTRERVEVSGRPGRAPNRLLLKMQRKEGPVDSHRLTIYHGARGHQLSAAFAQLTRAFYL
ncbi:MAG: methyltransferase domain-containing protein [Bacteroidetes bacterium]|nr:MAG: methyltransferase domain-containing protein [Bacteroidota bacterium]